MINLIQRSGPEFKFGASAVGHSYISFFDYLLKIHSADVTSEWP